MNNSAATRRITSIAIEYNGNDLGKAEHIYSKNLLGKSPEEKFQEMRIVAKRNPSVKKWALTGYISPAKEIGDKLSSQELKCIALEALKRVGLTKHNQVILDIHNSTKQKHIHFIVNRIDLHGKCTVKAANIGKLFGESVRNVCKEMNLKTDIELGKEKKEQMFSSLTHCLKTARNFNELRSQMSNLGFRVTLSENSKVGVSGMRIVHQDDINNNTAREYLAGYKLSDITSKLKIIDIKQILSDNHEEDLDRYGDSLTVGSLLKSSNTSEKQTDHKQTQLEQIAKVFLKPTYTSADDGLLRKKRRKFL